MSYKTSSYLKKQAYAALLSSLSVIALSGCDRTKADEEAITDTVEIEQTEPLVAGESVGESNIQVVENSAIDNAAPSEKDLSTEKQPSIVVSDVTVIKEGTPEATLAHALNTIYYGNANDAARYYQTDIEDFNKQLQNTQTVFQKTVEKVTITDINLNDAGDEATIEGTISLVGVEQPDGAEFKMKKIDGEWKILG